MVSDPGLSNASMTLVTVEIDVEDPKNINVQQNLQDNEVILVKWVPIKGLYKYLSGMVSLYLTVQHNNINILMHTIRSTKRILRHRCTRNVFCNRSNVFRKGAQVKFHVEFLIFK